MTSPTELGSEDVAWPFHPDHDAWILHGFPTWDDAQPWIEAHVSPVQAAEYIGWADPQESAAWVATGVPRRDAEDWRDRGFGASEAVEWSRRVGPREAVVWRGLGFTAAECHAWQKHVFEAGHAFMWRETGCSPNQAAAWSSAAAAAWNRRRTGQPTTDWAIRWFEDHHG